MERMKGEASFRNPGKQPLLPPKSPFPSISTTALGDYSSSASNEAPWLSEGQRQHQRTSSENFIIDDPPPWLDELLDETETSAIRGAHRRSSSDSFAYLNGSRRIYSNLNNFSREECWRRTVMSTPLWVPHEFDPFKDARHLFSEGSSSGRLKDTAWASGLNMGMYSNGLHAAKGKGIPQWPPGPKSKDMEELACNSGKKLEQDEHPEGLKCGSEKKDVSKAKHTQSETDSKRAKQQFAQRSRVRKLQYITELENIVQALQAEGLEVSAELQFLDQQNLILSLENKVLKQRIDRLSQEQLIRCLQQEMLQREIARLQLLFQQQQQQQQLLSQPSSSNGRNNCSRGLNSQFANLSIKH